MKEAFLSYAHEDKVLAGKVKQIIEANGVSAFLAHEDLEVSEDWRAEILKHLDTCSALIAIVTEKFRGSVWANQEVGIGIAKGLPMIPLMFGGSTALKGFLEMHQGIPVSDSNLEEAVKSVIPKIDEGTPSTERRFYGDLAGGLNRLIIRWQTYKSHLQNIKWTSDAVQEIKKSFRKESEDLLTLISNETEVDFGVKGMVTTIMSQVDQFALFKIDFNASYSEQIPQFQNFEFKGDQVLEPAKSLRGWLIQTHKVS